VTVDAAVERFLEDIAVAKAAGTVNTYRSVLRRFAEFLDGQQPRPATVDELTDEHPVGFARWVSDHGRAPRTTVQLYTTAVVRFYAFLVRERHRTDLQLETMHLRLAALRGKRPKRLPKVPPDEAIERMIAVARKRPPGTTIHEERIRLRNIAMLETLKGSGVRVSELVSLRRGDLDREQRRAVVTGKGGKQRLVFFTDEAWKAIWDYLAARGDGAGARGGGSAPLFARHDRGAGARVLALTTKSVREIVWELAREARLEDLGITPHRFRAWFATHLVAETGDLAAAQDLLGHESADTTRVYTRVAAQRLADVHRRAFGSGAHAGG
jgi:site-specific recombinase XerD